ncbi:WD40 repeat domain-containing serine/threonine protein kinase [Nocardiopsis alba]|uniref:WD40 repeat domain-containing serine/threonine protein kinase n=1 Tax=Nocardiopsis alba TaxID=53437 RepID=UPI0035E00924
MDPLHPTDPPYVGRYRLTARLGSGGMGQVYLARTASGRGLVIKVVRPELASEDGFRARFAREAEAARRVGGFHTAQVVDADHEADPPWIATAHIPGLTLVQAVREHGPLDPPALRILATGLAEGLDAIHRCGLVHRDLKPANIILATDGPRIIDFGVARPMDADSMTTHGTVFGTLPYMSPEQTESSRVGPASDIFSLGSVLAFAATGTGPFTGGTMAETLRRLLGPPPDPGEIDPAIRELIRDCWDHDPGRRPTPELILARFEADDLHTPGTSPHFAPSEESSALPSVPTDSGQTPPSPSAAPVTARGDLSHHTREQTSSPKLREEATTPPRAADTDSGEKRPRKGLYIGAAAVTALALVSALLLWRSDIGGAEDPAQAEEGRVKGPAPIGEHDDHVNTVAFDSDGDTVATAGSDGTARLWDVETGDLIATPKSFDGHVWSVAFSPDDATVASVHSDGTAQLWDIETEEPTPLPGHTGYVRSVAFGPDGSTVATTSDDRTTRLWNGRTGEFVDTLDGHTDTVNSVDFGPGGFNLATASKDGTARIWDIETGEPYATLDGHDDSVWSVAFSPEGAFVATASEDGTARIWNAGTGEPRIILDGHDGPVNTVAFSPDGTLLATGDGSGAARLWDAKTGEAVTTLEGEHTDAVWSVAFSPDGATLATASDDGTVLLWDIG